MFFLDVQSDALLLWSSAKPQDTISRSAWESHGTQITDEFLQFVFVLWCCAVYMGPRKEAEFKA